MTDHTETGGDPRRDRHRDSRLESGRRPVKAAASGSLAGDLVGRLRTAKPRLNGSLHDESADRIEVLERLAFQLGKRAEAAEQRAERYRVALEKALEWDGVDDEGVPAVWAEAARTALSETPEQTEGSDGSLRSLSDGIEAGDGHRRVSYFVFSGEKGCLRINFQRPDTPESKERSDDASQITAIKEGG